MKKSLIIIISLLSVAIFIAIIGVSTIKKEVRLKFQVDAQTKVCEGSFDKMWKVISQKAQIPEQYKKDFKEVYTPLIEGRYGNENGGTLMKWITESNPTFDSSLYKDLMYSIEAERMEFFMEQKKLIDINNEHNILLNSFPELLFVGSRPETKITVISSDRTKEVISTGKDNDIDVFKK